MPVSTVFGMVVLVHLCPGENVGAEHINAMAHGREQSHRQCSCAAVEELTCPRSPSSEYRSKKCNLRVLSASAVLYLLLLAVAVCLWTSLFCR